MVSKFQPLLTLHLIFQIKINIQKKKKTKTYNIQIKHPKKKKNRCQCTHEVGSLAPLSSRVAHVPAVGTAAPWSFLEMQKPGPTPDLLNQNLHF